jgi:hypothetical protein
MAVAIVDSDIIAENDGDPTTRTITVAEAGYVLYAAVVSDTATAHNPTITFNGDTMAQISVTTGTGQALSLHRLINPDVVVGGTLTTTAGTATRIVGYVLVSGADTTTPNGSVLLEETGSATTLSGGVGVSSSATGIVLAFATANNAGAITATGTNQTEIEEAAQGSATVLGISSTAGTGSEVVTSWSWIGANRATQMTLSVLPASGSSETTVTPSAGAFTFQGQQGSVNPFTNVRIREVLINEAGSPLSNMTGMKLTIWYGGAPSGAPDLSYSAVTTDTDGTMSYSIATGSLAYNQAIFYVLTDGSASLSAWTCGRMIPTYT